MEYVQSGPYVFRLGLYPDPDLSPANLGEAFDYYSAVPGWGWRAIVYRADGPWQAESIALGASLAAVDFAVPNPEGEMDSYFPCGRVVPLADGGVAFEGGVALPPQTLPRLGDEVAVWLGVADASGTYAAALRFRLAENESWDGLEPTDLRAEPHRPAAIRRVWSPGDEPLYRRAGATAGYVEPPRSGLPTELGEGAREALALARAEAHRLRREQPGSEDLLVALLRQQQGKAAQALREVGLGLPEVRAAVEFLRTSQLGQVATSAGSLLPSADKALQLAADEARRAGAAQVETSHLLLGLLRQRGAAVEALSWLGVNMQRLRELVRDGR